MIKAVIFDMDGLMVDSEPISYKASDTLLRKYGHKLTDVPEEVLKDALGKRVKSFVSEYMKILDIDAPVEQLMEERSEIFLKDINENLKMMPGLIDLLKQLKANNLKIALASSATLKYINIVLDKFDLRNYFDVILSGDDVKKGKPDPEVYLVAAEKLGLKPSECVVLEDALNGIKAAKAAGCKCIAIPGRIKQDLSIADKIVISLNDIAMEMLNSL